MSEPKVTPDGSLLLQWWTKKNFAGWEKDSRMWQRKPIMDKSGKKPEVFYRALRHQAEDGCMRPDSYWTTDCELAAAYRNGDGQSIYKGVLCPQKVFDTRDPKHRKIFDSWAQAAIDQKLEHHVYGTPLHTELFDGLPDWTVKRYLKKYLTKQHSYGPERWDAIKFHEGASGEYKRGESIMIFYPEDIINAETGEVMAGRSSSQ